MPKSSAMPSRLTLPACLATPQLAAVANFPGCGTCADTARITGVLLQRLCNKTVFMVKYRIYKSRFTETKMRSDGRNKDQIREVKITDNYLMSPDGSVLIEMGNTKVICTAIVEDSTARHLTGTGQGWVTCEYAMLPGSTGTRKKRDRGKTDGRSVEIQRLVGRALRSVVDMTKLGERTIWIDCDVIQADGGTRTASITGAFVAMAQAMKKLKDSGMIEEIPLKGLVAAVSVGITEEGELLDLCYEEDSSAIADMNVVMTDKGEYIEIQGTGEARPFSPAELSKLLSLAAKGCGELHKKQKEIIGEL